MNKIVFPLKPDMKGPAVADLQDALQMCLDRRVILPDDETKRQELSTKLKPERNEQFYGEVTSKGVRIFQEKRDLESSGKVDKPTADALNELLREGRAIDGETTPNSYIVSGRVRREDGFPSQNTRIRAVHEDKDEDEDELCTIRLGEDTTDAEGRYTIRYEVLPEEETIRLRICALSEDGQLLKSSDVLRNPEPLECIDLTIPIDSKPVTRRQIEGRIFLEHGLPAEKLKLRLYQREFGGGYTRLGETVTLAGGHYAFTYNPGDKAVSLEVRIVSGEGKETLLSEPLHDLNDPSRAVLNLVAPSVLQPFAAEYRRLSADLTPYVGQMTKLAQVKENDTQQDITVLNRATGWDARLIALAATTERLSADPDVKLPQEGMYGLLRAGLPSDKLLLAQVDTGVIEQALKTVRDAGIVKLDDQQITDFKKQFTTFATKVRLAMPAPGSVSSYGGLLKTSGLSDDAQARFAPVYLNHRGTTAQLWDEARQAGLDSVQISKLQLHGKLAFLAGNSEAMTARLMQKQITDPAQLVEQNFHRAEKWKVEAKALANNDEQKLAALIPTAYTGEKVEDRLDAYAQDMARKVRLSYPTQLVGRMLEQNELKLPDAHEITAKLLKNAAQQGFRLGQTPVTTFLKTHVGVTAGMADSEVKAAQQQLKMLQRLYQLTTSNEAMPVLMSLNMTSAYDVMAYSEVEFSRFYTDKYFDIYENRPPEEESQLIYRKAKQVSSVTYNLFTIVKKLHSDQSVAGMSASVAVRDSVRDALIKQFPTLESLFGSIDFCECEQCRSVLSPAAYLVDLLQFVDSGSPVKPYDVLEQRRPDLPHIALTCENTHTALPYIDLVNEILEYYVAYNKLAKDAVHDTGEASTVELLAEPQNIIREAYDNLSQAHYPLNLPFDFWIEIVRQFCNYFETPLARLLEVFRPNDDLFAPAKPFDRASIFVESLGFSPAELAVFTDANPLENDSWHKLYGFPTIRPAIQNPTNAEHATLTITNNEAGKFREGFVCTYFDVSANALSAETKTISTIGAPDSGGVNQTLIKFEGVWATSPNAGDLLVCHATATLKSAKTLSLRLGVTYKEIVEIVQSSFVNPELTKLSLLYKLGVSIHDVRFYLDHKELLPQDPVTLPEEKQKQRLEAEAFSQKLVDFAKNFAEKFGITKEKLEAELEAIPFNKILVLSDPDASCNFDLTTLRYANGEPADAITFLRINLFVRLWRKLGWSIEEIDRALQAFVPQNVPFDAAHLNQRPLKTALIYLAHLQTLDESVHAGRQSRLKLITLWSDIATIGKNPLYAQLFLTPSILKENAQVFDHPFGQYLSGASLFIKDYRLALQGPLGFTADEIEHILADAGQSFDTAKLSLPNVSLLYRYGLLAKALNLSVSELIALKQLSGLDPFKPLHPDPLTTIEEDYPFSQTLRFAEVAEEVKASGLKIEDLEYLLRHRFDEIGKYRPNREGTLALLKALAEGIHAIRTEHAVPDDPGTLSEEVLRQKLGLVLPPDVVERFLAMMNGTVEFTATKAGVAPVDQLKPEEFTGEPTIREVRYNATREEQKLTFKGVLFDAEKAALKARLPKPIPPNPHVPSPTLSDLFDDVQQQALSFFEKHLQKQAPNAQPAGGFLDAADFDLLFNPNLALSGGETEQERLRKRRTKLAKAFLPFLQQRLIHQFIVQTMTAQTGADSVLVDNLLSDERLLAGPKPLLEAFAATGERGVNATFFDTNDGSGTPQATTPFVTSVDTALKDKKDTQGNPLNPANSARFEGYLEVTTPGAYRFYIKLGKQNAAAELRFDHLPDPLFLKGVAATDDAVLGDKPNEFLELKPGIPYRFTLELTQLNGAEASLLVQGETLPKAVVTDTLQLKLYPLSTMAGAERATLLLSKALQLVQSLGLSEREIRYLLTHAAAFSNLSLSQLPTQPSGDTPADRTAAAERFAGFLRLAAYTRLKNDLAGGTDDLIDIFEANETTDPDKLTNKVYPLIAKLSRRDSVIIKATAEALFGVAPVFNSEQHLQRLWEALQVIERFGVSVTSLLKWLPIVSAAATLEQRFEIARDLKEVIKARFEPQTWQSVAQPIFDKLRQRQRDALVSYIMHQRNFARMEQLYEYFLIDPGMEPVVQTTRVRLAIASLQLFIQRCLLNLEPQVSPSLINAKQWEWMKRYRVWEANRKIFLFPENWLEPEFRDDKTHLFSELEGALLQGDVSSDLVEDAFLNYLKKLDELARLDIIAMHLDDHSIHIPPTLHVIGRTYSQPRKYFYRRYQDQMWTPWEPVNVEIEGDHLAPVVWRDRLYLFWVTFMDKSSVSTDSSSGSSEKSASSLTISEAMNSVAAHTTKKVVGIQLHWSEYLQGKWSTHESGSFSESMSLTVSRLFTPNSVFIHVSKEKKDGEERGVYIHLGGAIKQAFYLAGRNSTPERVNATPAPVSPYAHTGNNAGRYAGNLPLAVSFTQSITTELGKESKSNIETLNILQQSTPYILVPCDSNLTMLGTAKETEEIARLMKPIFYQDNTYTLFVEPSVTERTIDEWQEWVTRKPQPESSWKLPDWWKDIVIGPKIPWKGPIPDPWLTTINPGSLTQLKQKFDWLVNPGTGFLFDGVLIGPVGQPGVEILPTDAADSIAKGGLLVNVSPGSPLKPGSIAVLTRAATLEEGGLKEFAGGLNIIGGPGFNAALWKNFDEQNRSGFAKTI